MLYIQNTDVVTQNDIPSDYILTFWRDLLNADILTQYCDRIDRMDKLQTDSWTY